MSLDDANKALGAMKVASEVGVLRSKRGLCLRSIDCSECHCCCDSCRQQPNPDRVSPRNHDQPQVSLEPSLRTSLVLTQLRDFYYNADETIKPPLAVRVAEARLVDGMIPLSKFTVWVQLSCQSTHIDTFAGRKDWQERGSKLPVHSRPLGSR
jgi:hypothetical protein